MPPEFRNSGCITDKNDVFGLGVLIIQLMDGKNGLTHSTEMSVVHGLLSMYVTKITRKYI